MKTGSRGIALAVGLMLGLTASAWADPSALAPESPEASTQDAPPEAAVAPAPAPIPALRSLEAAWRSRGDLGDRAAALRAAAIGRGIRSVDGAARSLLLDANAGDALARARTAVALAPDLPDARLALARALWADGSPGTAAVEARAALAGLGGGHLEAALGFEVTLRTVLAHAALWAGALFLLAAALFAAPGAGRQVAAAWPGGLPGVSGFAWVAVAVTTPAALGEGWAGLALGAAGLAIAYGTPALRVATAAAVALTILGLHPLADRAGHAVASFTADPVTQAAWRSERDVASPLELARLERAAGSHPLADRALALHARREGRLEESDRRFRALLSGDAEASLLHNAANVRFALGRDAEAIELYRRAIAVQPRAATWWNLSQAHGRSIQIDEQDAALREAQKLDASYVSELTESVAETRAPVLLDLPLEAVGVRSRVRDAVNPAGRGRALRAVYAPGLLGRNLITTSASFVVLALAALLAGAWLRSRPSASADEEVYAGIARVLQGRDKTDPSLRRARLSALRQRRERHDRIAFGVALVVPGAAGVQSRHPFLGLATACAFAIALAGLHARAQFSASALAGAETSALALGLVAAMAGFFYVAATGAALLVRGRG